MPLWLIIVLIVGAVVGIGVVVVELLPHHRFIDAAGHKDPKRLEEWLAKGRDPNRAGLMGLTALSAAVVEGREQNVQTLLERGADPNCASVKILPLEEALDRDRTDIVRLLVDHGADFNKPGLFGRTPLENAAVEGRVEALRLFLAKGADASAKSADGDPLVFTVVAAILGSKKEEKRVPLRQALQTLLDHGASPNVRSTKDIPLVAFSLADPPSLRIIVDAGAIIQVAYDGTDLEGRIRQALKEG